MKEPLAEMAAPGASIWVGNSPHQAARWLVYEYEQAETSDSIRVGQLEVSVAEWRVTWWGCSLPLSGPEYKTLALLAGHVGHAYSFEEITRAVWARPYLGDSSAVRSAIKRLRKKLLVAGGSLAIESIRGVGFRLVVDR